MHPIRIVDSICMSNFMQCYSIMQCRIQRVSVFALYALLFCNRSTPQCDRFLLLWFILYSLNSLLHCCRCHRFFFILNKKMQKTKRSVFSLYFLTTFSVFSPDWSRILNQRNIVHDEWAAQNKTAAKCTRKAIKMKKILLAVGFDEIFTPSF